MIRGAIASLSSFGKKKPSLQAVGPEGNAGPFTPAPATTLTTVTLHSASSSGVVPVAFGVVFKDGEMPAGSSLSGVQFTAKTHWPSGSVKHGVAATIVTRSSTTHAIPIGVGSAISGNNLTTASLKATNITASIDAGAFGSASWATTDWDAPFQTLVSGPVMSSWLYRKQIGSDAHLVAWLEVRLWANGACEVFPSVENASLFVTGPTNKLATYTFALNGVQRFSQSIDVKHHARIPLINTVTGQGSATSFSHWVGTDPGITTTHDVAHLTATKLVPNFGYTDPVDATLSALDQTYVPNSTYGSTGYGPAGSAAALLGHTSYKTDVQYVQTGDPRAYRASLAFALSGGSWSLHYRDETASGVYQHQPVRFSSYPNISITVGGTPDIPAGTGGTVGSPTSFTHWPSYGYLAYLLTGRHWFLDEAMFWLSYRFIWFNYNYREFADGIAYGATRAKAWYLRDVAYCLSALPDTHPLRDEYRTVWEKNMDKFYDRVITGTRDGGKYLNNALGVIDLDPASYSDYATQDGHAWATHWQLSYLTMAIGQASNMGLPLTAQGATRTAAVRDFAYKHAVGLAGDGTTGNWNWRMADSYTLPYGTGATLADGTDWTSFNTSWGVVYDEFRINTPAANPANTPANAALVGLDGNALGSASRYLADHMASLAYAVEHGAPGAAAAWNRMQAASNSSIIAARIDSEYQQMGITPRSGLEPSVLIDALDGLTAGAAFSNFSSLTNVTEITDTTGPNGTARNWMETEANAPLTNWPGKVTWMDTGNQVCFVGTAEGYVSDTPLGNHAKVVFIDADTGQFSVQWNPFGRNTGHLYDSNSSRELNGYVYKKPYNWNTIYRMNVITKVWSTYHDMVELDSTFGFGVAVAMDVFPTMGAQGSLIFVNGGKVARHDIATGQNTLLSAGLTGTIDAYNVCSYHPGIDAMVLGGGQNVASHLYKLTSNGTFTQLTNSLPAGVPGVSSAGAIGTVLLPDPFGRAYAYLMDCITTGFLYRLDLITGVWTQLVAVPAITVGRSHNTAVSVPGHGIMLIAGRGRANDTTSLSSVWGYKPD